MVVLSVGAATLARLLAIDSGLIEVADVGDLEAGALEALILGAAPPQARKVESSAATAASSRSAHSQTTSVDQPAAASAASAASSRARLRAILVVQ